MTDSIFKRTHLARCQAALTRAASLGNEGHAGLRGKLREILVTDILKPVVPPEVRFGSGQLVTIDGALSHETDVVLYAPSIMMPSLFDDISGFFPIESVLYAIEVKSRLTRRELKTSIKKARAVLDLRSISTEHVVPTFDDNIVAIRQSATPNPICALFCFGSDLIADPSAELARYRSLDDQADTRPLFSVLCIVGRGYWYFADRWKFCAADSDRSEIMAWLAGTTNTLPQLIVAKGRPRFGMYLSSSSIVDAT